MTLNGTQKAPWKPLKSNVFLSIAAGELFAGPAIARFIKLFGANLDYEAAKQKSERLLVVINQALQYSAFLAAEHITIADIALYTYIKHAPEGGVDTQQFPVILAWLATIEQQDGFIPMS